MIDKKELTVEITEIVTGGCIYPPPDVPKNEPWGCIDPPPNADTSKEIWDNVDIAS